MTNDGGLRATYGPWRVLDDRRDDDPVARVARDLRIAGEIARANGAAPAQPVFRVWTNRRALVATRRETRLPRFVEAAEASAERGWPVVVRDSGGTLIPHLPGTLHLTLLLPRLRSGEPGVDAVFRGLCAPVIETLRECGVDAAYGSVPKSFCDGRFNLVSQGRKLAGTAQRWRGGIPGAPVRPGFVLAHLSLFVDGDMPWATEAVNRFLRQAGGTGAFDPHAAITVREARGDGAPNGLDRPALVREVREALVDRLRRSAGPAER